MRNHAGYTSYYLHFDTPVGRVQHYRGICRSTRLDQRMLEHASGRGAALTKRAALAGVGFYLVETIQESSFEQERKLKHSGNPKARCPICSKGQNPILLNLRHFDPRITKTPGDVKIVSWIAT